MILPRTLLTKCVLQAKMPAFHSGTKPHPPALETQYPCPGSVQLLGLNTCKLNLHKRTNEA